MNAIAPQVDFQTECARLFDLRGRVAYVPGGYGGLGEAIAWGLATRGARVAVSGRDAEKAEALADALRAAGFEAMGIAMDAHSVPDINASIESVADTFGALDILMNCVGIQREESLLEVKQHAMELAPHGITVNGIAPTVVRTEMARHWLDNPDSYSQVLARIPLGRVADPIDVVGAAIFFSSPASDFVTGQILYVDGGVTAGN